MLDPNWQNLGDNFQEFDSRADRSFRKVELSNITTPLLLILIIGIPLSLGITSVAFFAQDLWRLGFLFGILTLFSIKYIGPILNIAIFLLKWAAIFLLSCLGLFIIYQILVYTGEAINNKCQRDAIEQLRLKGK